jgi:hypothetical protein
MPNNADCGIAKDRVDALADDALKEIGKMEREHLPKELKADLAKVERDLKAIKGDPHTAD